MTSYAYLRVSTSEQNLDMQRSAIERQGYTIDEWYEEIASGAKDDRPVLATLLDKLKKDDNLIVYKLDRLGRSLTKLLTIIQEAIDKEWNLISASEKLDTSTPIGRFTLNIMGSLAQFERELIVERTKDGLEAARKAGKHLGRPEIIRSDEFNNVFQMYINGNIKAREASNRLHISPRRLQQMKKAKRNLI